MVFTQEQILGLLDIIERYHVIYIATNVDKSLLTSDDRKILKQAGIDLKGLVDNQYLELAFKFGILSEAIGDKRSKSMNYEEFKKFLASGKFIPLNQKEQLSIESVKRQAYKDIKGLGNRVKSDLQTVVIEADRKQRVKYEKIIESAAQKTIENRESVKFMISELGTKTEDWGRDFGRIADYVMHTAYDEGRAASIEHQFGDEALVYKLPYPQACKYCVKVYLTKGTGSEPRIYKISELIANGTNIGRKADEQRAVIGATHPWSLTDGTTPILTKSGWKMIKDIEIGEKVLTHKGRFRAVVSKVDEYKPTKDYPIKQIYHIEYNLQGEKNKISLTAEHKVLTQRGWFQVQNLKIEDKLIKVVEEEKHKFEEIPISNIKTTKITKETRLWDIGVEEDESFVAKGIVIHNCRCTLSRVPQGYKWNPKTQSFDIPIEFKRKVERTSKIKIKIGEKESEI